jgi:tricorn protease
MRGSRLARFGDRFRLEHATWLVNPDAATPPQELAAGSPVAWSPNGRQLAVERPAGLHVVDAATGVAKLIFPGTFVYFGDWAPDSRKLALVVQSRRIDKEDIRVVNADGTGRYDPTQTPKRSSDFTPVWSPDGRRLAFVRNYSAGFDFGGPVTQQPRFDPPRTFVIPAKGGLPRPLRPLRSGEYIRDWR